MAAFLLRLMALVAVTLMPFAMTAAPAAVATAAPTAGAEHCSGHEQPEVPAADMESGCLACIGLPATPDMLPAEAMIPRAPRTIAQAQPFRGIEPAIATPPPKFA